MLVYLVSPQNNRNTMKEIWEPAQLGVNVFLRFFVVPDPTSLNSSRPQNCDPCHALRFGDPLGLCQKKLGFAEGLSIEWHQA